MAENSKISWTTHTFNPWMGCQKVSHECDHCYAETLVTGRMGLDLWGGRSKRKRTSKGLWQKVRTYNRIAEQQRRPRKVFVASLADVFEDAPGPNEWRGDVWDLIRECPWLDFQLLTKRPENIERMLPDDWGDGWRHVWLGTSIGIRDHVERADVLRQVPAAVRFISAEPLIGPLVCDGEYMEPGTGARYPVWTDDGSVEHGGRYGEEPSEDSSYVENLAAELELTDIDWLIVGGESGPGWRPMALGWAVDLLDAAGADDVAFFFKQIAAPRPGQGADALGGLVQEFPPSWDRAELLEAVA